MSRMLMIEIFIMAFVLSGLVGLLIGTLIDQYSVWIFLHKKFNIPFDETIADKLTLK